MISDIRKKSKKEIRKKLLNFIKNDNSNKNQIKSIQIGYLDFQKNMENMKNWKYNKRHLTIFLTFIFLFKKKRIKK